MLILRGRLGHRCTALRGHAIPSRAGKRRRSLNRAALVASFAFLAGATGALAQAKSGATWLEGIFSSPGYSNDSRPEQKRQPEVLDDLRRNAVPLRSDEILESTDRAIGYYQKIVNAGGWPQIPGNRMMRPGDDDERITILRKRLAAEGYLSKQNNSYASYTFDSALEAAVQHFQQTHGLRASGRADKPTLAELNITADARLAQLNLNYSRIRELMQLRPEERYILVNVPAFQLEAVERYEVQLRHRVIVGRVERQTPAVHATIKALNFFPYWRVPDSVGTLDLIPKLQKEPDYVIKEKIRVLNGVNGAEIDPSQIDWFSPEVMKFKFRQDPGPQNALGLVRLDMQNEHGVYMHDTPMKQLFQQSFRAFSAGCVRVQDVFKLAEWIARYEAGWERPGRVEDVLASGQALDLNLTRPLPVYFTYITAWAEPDGRIEFRPDLYNRDGAQSFAASVEREPGEAPPPPPGLAP